MGEEHAVVDQVPYGMDARGKWVRDTVAQEIVTKNWPGASLLETQLGDKLGGNAADGGFASVTYRLVLRVSHATKEKNTEEQTLHLLVKVCPEEIALRAMHNSELQFANESWMYDAVIPGLKSLNPNMGKSLWPKCLLSRVYTPELAIVVMEDLSKQGFRLAHPAAALDIQHATLALQRLAQFHALAYILKSKQPEQYRKFMQNFKETSYTVNGGENLEYLVAATVQRGIKPLRSRPECADLVAAMDRNTGEPYSLLCKLFQAKNPATDIMCHGDFCRNNILYKYDDKNKPCDLRLIDFATIRESSPATDIVLFLYLSVSEEARQDSGLTTLLKTYYDSLIAALPDTNMDPWQGNFDTLVQEVGRHALIAYCICSFFLPVMIADASDFQMEDMMTMTPEEQIDLNLNLGGEKATSRLVNILLDFKKQEFYKLW